MWWALEAGRVWGPAPMIGSQVRWKRRRSDATGWFFQKPSMLSAGAFPRRARRGGSSEGRARGEGTAGRKGTEGGWVGLSLQSPRTHPGSARRRERTAPAPPQRAARAQPARPPSSSPPLARARPSSGLRETRQQGPLPSAKGPGTRKQNGEASAVSASSRGCSAQ